MKLKGSDLFLWALALILMSVSFWQTWLGYVQVFGDLSFVVSLVLSLLLLYLLFETQKAKREGKSTATLTWIYVFLALFSFVGNFNAIYTRFMRTEIYTDELRRVVNRYNQLKTDIDNRLTYIVDATTRQSITSDVNQLVIQIKDPSNHGIGPKARVIIAQIEKKLGKKLTLLTPISNNQAGYDDLAERMTGQINDMMDVLTPEEKRMSLEINNAVTKWNRKMIKLLGESNEIINKTAVGVINEAVLEYNKLGNNAQNVLGHSKYAFENLKSNMHNVGKIGYAFRHAVENFGIFQIIVLGGCILLDFVVFIIMLLVERPDAQYSSINNDLSYKRRGKTLIN